MKTSQKSGAGTDDLYLPRLWCYHTLAFLSDGDKPPDSTSNLDELLLAAAAREAQLSWMFTTPPTPSLRLVRDQHTSHSVYGALDFPQAGFKCFNELDVDIAKTM